MGYRYNPFSGEFDRVLNEVRPINSYPVTPYVVGPVGQAGYQTIQSAINAVQTDGGNGQIWVQPGTYTEDLIFPDGIDVGIITGSDEDAAAAEIVGVHTPPDSGNVVLWRMKMTSSTHIFSSNSAGTAALVCSHNNYSTDGYIFNCPNWTGSFTTFAIGDFLSTSDGIINNTGGATAVLFQSGLGVGTTNPCIISGTCLIQLMDISTPITIQGSAACEIEYSTFFDDITFADSSSGYMTSCRMVTGSDAAITYSTSGNFEVSNVSFNSSNNPCLDGAGAGILNLNGVNFEDNSNIAGTLTLGAGNTYSGTYKSDYTDGGVLLGQGTASNIIASTAGADGQLLIGATGADPIFASLSVDHTMAITEGPNSLSIAFSDDAHTTAIHGWNGSLLETAAVTVTSDGVTITCSVEKSGGGDLTAVFSDDFYDWDTTPADTVTLTAGTDVAPQVNYVYLLQSNKTLTSSIAGWPATEHAPMCTAICQSAASLLTDGPYKVHVWTDHVTATDQQGHISHLNFWIRQQNATWVSLVTQTYTITPNGGAPDNVTISTLAGTVLQLHDHTYPAFAAADDYYVINDSVTAYDIVNDLNALLLDSNGVSMSGKYFSLVLWGVVSEDTGDCKRFINLPSGSYNNQAGVEADSSGYANFTIPEDYKGTGFLISEWKLRHQAAASGTWSSVSEIDLRGLIPSISPSGSTATPVEFADNTFRIFDDGDDTKKIAFQASGITAATTRTLTVQDADGIIALSGVANYGTGAQTFTDHGVLVGSGTSPITPLAAATNGQLVIGSSGVDPAVAALASADASVTITNGAGTIDLAVAMGGIPWTEVTVVGPTAMAVDNGYVANNAALVTLTLPDTAAFGSILKVDGKGAGGWKIAQNAGETIHYLGQDTTPGAGGSLASTTRYDCITLRCITANTDWVVEATGNLTVV